MNRVRFLNERTQPSLLNLRKSLHFGILPFRLNNTLTASDQLAKGRQHLIGFKGVQVFMDGFYSKLHIAPTFLVDAGPT